MRHLNRFLFFSLAALCAPDEPAAGAGAGGAATPPAPAPAATPPAPAPPMFTPEQQAAVDKIVKDRLARAKGEDPEYKEALKALGIGTEGGPASFAEWQAKQAEERARAEAAALEAAKQQGKYKELWEVSQAAQAKAEAEAKRVAESFQAKLASKETERAILEAATGAVNPSQVVALLRNSVRYDATADAVEVIGADGKLQVDDKGKPVTVKALVENWLKLNPHFQQPSGRAGTGTGNVPASGPAPAPKGTAAPGKGMTVKTGDGQTIKLARK
jgi:hypothetical protein